MFRTVSEIRAGNGRGFIAENASASSNEGHVRSERRREALVANAKDFSDFWGHHVDLLEGASRRSVSGTLFFSHLPAKVRRYARSDLHKMEHRTGPRLHFSELGMSEAQPPARSPPQAPRAQGVRRPGPARGPERGGRLGATPGDAPVASTPPRRREPGR